MMKFCDNCGEKLSEGKQFCTSCGMPVQAEAPAVTRKSVTAAPTREQRPRPHTYAEEPVLDKKYEPITTKGYIGIFLLMCIPVVGLLLTIIWACGGCQKINKRNLARASLILLVIGLIISLILGIVVKIAVGEAVDSFEEKTGISITDDGKLDTDGLLKQFTDNTGDGDTAEDIDLDSLSSLAGLLGMLSGDKTAGSSSDLEALKDLEGLLSMLGNDSGGLSDLVKGVEGINRQAEAANSGWPSSLRKYPGGTATAVASYRTEITNTSLDEMLSWIQSLKSDGFVYKDFYDFGMTEQDMLSVNGWWATDGAIYLSISWDGQKVIVDHTTELPDLSSLFG